MTSDRKIPLWALALDVVGTLFVAAGLYGLFAGDTLPAYRDTLESLAVPLIVLGVLLMAPLVITAIRQVKSSG